MTSWIERQRGLDRSTLYAVVLATDGTFSCRTSNLKVGPLQKEQLASVLQAQDCPAALAAYNAKWNDVRCDDGDMVCAASARSAHADAPNTLGILLALASSLMVRRLSR